MDKLLDRSIAVLSITPDRWQALTAQVDEDLLTRAPGEEEWSAVECLLHLIDTERWVFPVRVRAFLSGKNLPGFDPQSQGTKEVRVASAEVMAEEFKQLRQESLKLLATLTETDLERTAVHAELGLVSLSQMLHEWTAHDLDHTVQAERALMIPFVQGCGPWQIFFK
jgi:hypothetical protein